MWTWKDPVADPPPFRTRIRIRLSDDYRKANRIKPTCADGYLIEPDTHGMSGFCTVLGPHVTGWMPIRAWPTAPGVTDTGSTEELRESLRRIGESIEARVPQKPNRHWQDESA